MKKYRQSQNEKYKTVSLKFSKVILQKLEKATEASESKNISDTIEKIVSGNPTKNSVDRRGRGLGLVKKTFTFTDSFYQKIKKTGNMSQFVEQSLTDFFA